MPGENDEVSEDEVQILKSCEASPDGGGDSSKKRREREKRREKKKKERRDKERREREARRRRHVEKRRRSQAPKDKEKDSDEPSDSDGPKTRHRSKRSKSYKHRSRKYKRSRSSSSSYHSSSFSSSTTESDEDSPAEDEQKSKEVDGPPPAKKPHSKEKRRGRILPDKKRPTSGGKTLGDGDNGDDPANPGPPPPDGKAPGNGDNGNDPANPGPPPPDGKAPGNGNNGDDPANPGPPPPTRTDGKAPSGDNAVHGTPGNGGANNVTPATGAPQHASMQPFLTSPVDLVTGLPSAYPPQTSAPVADGVPFGAGSAGDMGRPTNLEEVRRVLYDAVTFAYDVRNAIASRDYDRFQDLYQNMVAVLPRWMETRDSFFQGNFDVMSPVYDRYLRHMVNNHCALLAQLSKGAKDDRKKQ